ncbi:MAG: hypothetical protein ACE5DO_07610 [Desulfobacterales bacterium]
MRKPILTIKSLSLLFIAISLSNSLAQDSNFLLPIKEIERRFQFEDLDIFKFKDARFRNDIVKRLILRWSDGSYTQAKWKRAPSGGHITNNAPRYEIAAYQFQKLFLDENEYVVPPTIMRCFPLKKYRELERSIVQIKPTFGNTQCVCIVLQYWLQNVGNDNIYDKKRFENDATYARHLANMNIFSYLIRHNDSNIGNFLISRDPNNPRVFAVDNGMAFDSRESERGHEWRDIRVKRLPRKTLERVRNIQLETLHKILGVVAQYEIQDGQLKFVESTENINPKKGVRISENVIQLGLTKREIDGIFKRRQQLIKKIDAGKIKIF